jgi:hypothetical protein
MRITNIYRYYAIGFNYNLLQRCDSGWKVKSGKLNLKWRIEEFLGFLDELQLKVTAQAASPIRSILQDLLSLPEDATVGQELAKKVMEAFHQIDSTLDAELQLSNAFIVTSKRFSVDQLLNNPDTLLAINVFNDLPPICKYDFSEACICIAFDRSTAAAFHLMRCIEGYLRIYYCSIVKYDRVKKLLWFEMINHLQRRRKIPPKPLLDNLNNIRENYRNPTQHPDARYDIDQAQDLLAITIDALNRISRELGNIK